MRVFWQSGRLAVFFSTLVLTVISVAVGRGDSLEDYAWGFERLRGGGVSSVIKGTCTDPVYNTTTGGQLLLTMPQPTSTAFSRMGRAVGKTPDGNILVGAPGTGGTTLTGEAYIFNRTTGNLMQTISNPLPQAEDGFGAYIWSTPTKIVIGAPLDDDAAVDGGRAFVFNTSGTLLNTLTRPGAAAGDWFGWSVNAVGENVLVGCRHDDNGGTSDTESGSCYMFDSLSGAFLRKFTRLPAPVTGDNLGLSVAGVGTRVLIGAPGVDGVGTTDCGGAFVYDSLTGNLVYTLSNPHPADNAYMGFLVRAVGSDFLVGSPGQGYAYLFSGATGALIREFPNPEPNPCMAVDHRYFAAALDYTGNYILLGNPETKLDGSGGAVYVYNLQTGNLLYKVTSPLNENNFGVNVAGLSNTQLLVGENYSKINGFDQVGRAYLFNVSTVAAADSWWLQTE